MALPVAVLLVVMPCNAVASAGLGEGLLSQSKSGGKTLNVLHLVADDCRPEFGLYNSTLPHACGRVCVCVCVCVCVNVRVRVRVFARVWCSSALCVSLLSSLCLSFSRVPRAWSRHSLVKFSSVQFFQFFLRSSYSKFSSVQFSSVQFSSVRSVLFSLVKFSLVLFCCSFFDHYTPSSVHSRAPLCCVRVPTSREAARVRAYAL